MEKTGRLARGWEVGAVIMLAIGFIVLAAGLSADWLHQFDDRIGSAVHSVRNEGLTSMAKGVTMLGKSVTDGIVFVIVALVLLLKWKQKGEALVLLIGTVAAWGLNTLLKGLFERARPLDFLVVEDGFSFPSGHAMVSSFFYGLVGYLIWINVRDKWRFAWIVPTLTAVMIFAISLTRIYLGVHYPSDVLAGLTAGGVLLLICIFAVRTIGMRRASRAGFSRPSSQTESHKVTL
ncbi:phosphatase PAP2 family protein [Paenibacillus oryzisoli]|uniref:phosphatase PAP2 family protein n=1 Tax=Paenibacillus oryzisoli TaxID=1850517 RepID=UPI003D2B2E2F